MSQPPLKIEIPDLPVRFTITSKDNDAEDDVSKTKAAGVPYLDQPFKRVRITNPSWVESIQSRRPNSLNQTEAEFKQEIWDGTSYEADIVSEEEGEPVERDEIR